jgi:hypothetical protein
MIAKAIKGKGFRGALNYDLNEAKGRILSTNMAGRNPRELAAEFGAIRRLRPNLGKAVLHVSLSATPGEKLSDDQWREITHKYLAGMHFDDNQFVVTCHTDTEHEHIHILANRITHAGGVISDSQDYKRQETIMRKIERDYGLQRVAPSIEAERKASTKGEIEGALRTGQPSARQQLQQLADAAAKDCPDFTTYAERLEAAGVELVPVAQLGGAKLSGLSYRLDGVTMKGSDLGKGYTAAGIQKRGITYEQDRDFEAVRRSIERDASRAFGDADRELEAGQAQERGGLGRDARATGPSNGRTGGRDTPDAGGHRPQEQGAGREVQRPSERGGKKLEGSRSRGAESSRSSEPSRAADGVAALPAGRAGGRDYSGSRDRILALAGTADHPEPDNAGRSSRGRASQSRDRTGEAIQRQIAALDVPRFEVGIRQANTGQMMNREWSRDELEQSAAWLKRMNAKGNDVYIRPAGEHGLVLVDDLKPAQLERMKADGFAPAASIETSPGNYQAWVKLSDKPLSADVRRVAAQALAKHYEGDPNSADSRHYGRLAGFTNQKPQHAKNGRQPYVLAHDCPGKASENAYKLISEVQVRLDKAKAEKERQSRLEALEGYKSPGHGWMSDPGHEYCKQAQRLMQRYGKEADFSRLDWMIATDMAKSGRFSAEGIAKAIGQHSPHVEERKAGHIEDYARRTAEKAWAAPEVQAHRQQQERDQQTRQAKRDRDGPSMSR